MGKITPREQIDPELMEPLAAIRGLFDYTDIEGVRAGVRHMVKAAEAERSEDLNVSIEQLTSSDDEVGSLEVRCFRPVECALGRRPRSSGFMVAAWSRALLRRSIPTCRPWRQASAAWWALAVQ